MGRCQKCEQMRAGTGKSAGTVRKEGSNMNKEVMISIRPEWLSLIVSDKKTVEVRKTRPKIEPPFRCYIYETKSRLKTNRGNLSWWYRGSGSVIGEFICDEIKPDIYFANGVFQIGWNTCMSDVDLVKYAGYDQPLFYWHISDLVIYDTPRPLSDFGLKRPPQSWGYVKEATQCGTKNYVM